MISVLAQTHARLTDGVAAMQDLSRVWPLRHLKSRMFGILAQTAALIDSNPFYPFGLAPTV